MSGNQIGCRFIMVTLSATTATSLTELTDKMQRLQVEKRAAVELQQRKHQDWDDNYELNRGKVKTNRLTQRQAVNIPLMKETIKTLLARIDDPPEIEWKELGGDEQKELFYQEIWNTFTKNINLELIDILDKKNVLLYGLSTKKLNITENGITADVLDVYDIALDPLMNAWDLESGRYIIHQNIFRSIEEIMADDRYTAKGKSNLKIWLNTVPGIVQSGLSRREWDRKMERYRDLRDRKSSSRSSAGGFTPTSVRTEESKLFAAGDTIVNLTEHYTRIWNNDIKKYERHVVTYAENQIELLDDTLEDLIGVTFWPFITWSEDPETNDVYPDSVADLVRAPNKIINVWYSQLVENRTLKNFQMHWYMPTEGYTPQTYTPGPGMMLPAPRGDDIKKVIRPVEVSGLDDTLEAIAAITNIVERGTGATAIQKGQGESGTQTLGEVEILVGKADERATAMTKFYRLAWYEFAWKWDALMHANPPKMMKLFKLGRSGKGYVKKVLQSDWKSKDGYEPIVSSTSEQEQNSIKTIQKFQFLLGMFPNNMALRKIAQTRSLDVVDLTPEELKQVSDEEDKIQEQTPAQPIQPEQPDQLGQEIDQQTQQLEQLV